MILLTQPSWKTKEVFFVKIRKDLFTLFRWIAPVRSALDTMAKLDDNRSEAGGSSRKSYGNTMEYARIGFFPGESQ